MKITKDDKTALIFGATGLVGNHLLNFLLFEPTYNKVIAFSRREIQIEHPKLISHVIDFSKLDEYSHLISGDDLYCALGTTIKKAGSKDEFLKVDFVYSMQIAKAALKNGVNQFLLVSSVGADKDSLFFYNKVKGQLEEAIKKINFWSTHIFRPSILLGERNENRWGEEIAGFIGRRLNLLSGGLLTKYKPVEADVVAKAMVSAAQNLKKGVFIYPSSYLQELADKING